jgi:hypothetical protein
MSRPTKYSPTLVEQARYITAIFGATDEQLAKALGVGDRTVYDWKATHPEFLQAVSEGKAEFDNRCVERSILACAQGYWYQEEKYDSEAGVIVRLWKFRHPDIKAQALWLCNRQGWRLPPAGSQGGPALPPPAVRGNDLPPGMDLEPDAEQLAQLGELARATMAERYGTRIRVPSQEVEPPAAAAEPEKQDSTPPKPNENEHDKEKK